MASEEILSLAIYSSQGYNFHIQCGGLVFVFNDPGAMWLTQLLAEVQHWYNLFQILEVVGNSFIYTFCSTPYT